MTDDMVLSSIQEMKLRKSPGPSSIIVKMLKASPNYCSQLIAALNYTIAKEGTVSEEWNNSFIESLFKGKRSATDRGNHSLLNSQFKS